MPSLAGREVAGSSIWGWGAPGILQEFRESARLLEDPHSILSRSFPPTLETQTLETVSHQGHSQAGQEAAWEPDYFWDPNCFWALVNHCLPQSLPVVLSPFAEPMLVNVTLV